MNSYCCIIVDDEADAIELLVNRLNKLYKNIYVVATYSDWEDALTGLKQEQCDLIFMDVSLPGKNGMQLLKLIPQLDSEIIFVTAHEQYALDAFSFTTSGYVLKPIDDIEFSNAIDIAISRIQNKRLAKQIPGVSGFVNDKIGITNNQGIDYVVIKDILYLESINKCTRIVAVYAEYISSLNLGRFRELIEKYSFFQVHRSYIINLNSILRYQSSGVVIMSNKNEIPVSRNVRGEFLEVLGTRL